MGARTTLGDARVTTSLRVPVDPFDARDHQHSGFGGDYVPLDQMTSAAPDGLRSADRDDPFHTRLWDGPTQAMWRNAATDARDISGGQIKPSPRRTAMLRQPPLEKLWGNLSMDMMAAALMWRTVTADQMAALTGVRTWCGRQRGDMPAIADGLYSMGLLACGILNRPTRTTIPVPTLIRPGTMSTFDSAATPLSALQWLEVTGGTTPGAMVPFARHNILAAEAALRLSEFASPKAMLGENVCSLSAMTGSDAGRARGDFAMVRADGLTIAFEVTTGTKGLEDKIARWGAALAADPDRRTAVVFLAADSYLRRHRKVFTSTRSMLGTYLSNDAVALSAKLGQRMFVVNWSDWFGDKSVIADIAQIPVWASGKEKITNWRRLDLGDTDATPWRPGPDAAARARRLIVGADLLRGQPHFLRTGQFSADVGLRLDAAMVRDAGFTDTPAYEFRKPTPDGRTGPSRAELDASWKPGPI